MSLLHRLLVLVLLAVLPAVGVGAYHEFELRQIRGRQVHDEALRLARLADSEIGRIAEATHELLTAFAENPFVGNGNWGECNTAAAHLMSHFDAYFNIGVVTTEGEIVCSGRPRSRGLNVRSSDAFNRAVAADDFLIGTYTTSVLDGSKILPFTEALLDADGKKSGFIFAALQLDWLKQQFVGRFADPNVSLLVVDRNSTILLRIPDPERWVGSQLDAKYSELLHATADGTAEITGVDGVRRIIGYSPLAIDPVGIYVGVGLTKAEVFAAIDGATLKGSVLVALCLCLALMAAWVGGIAFLHRPIDALLRAAESWRRGDYSVRTAMTDSRSELARLGRAFDDMAAELERREGEIRQANELLEQRVAERTTELLEANQRLATETEERRRAEAVLHHAQKLESIGQLTSGVAHDFNNLLTAVLGNLEIACMQVTDESVLKLLASATRAAERGAHLNEQLLAFARKQHLQFRPVNVNELVRGMGEMLKHSIGASVHIEQRLASDLWPAMADQNQVELAILNLAINARDSMPVGGRLSIETTNSDPGDPHRPAELSPGDYVCIAVSDTGTGMSEEVASRVLEPFFTTKGPGEGSGLGLSMVYGVAKQSGGGLSLSTRIGEGTTVRVYLPRAAGMQKMHSDVPAASEIGVNALSGTSVLLIDDDADVRQVTTTVLIHLGCRVEPTDSGVAALALLDRGNDFDIAIVDFAMPGTNGVEVAEKILARRQGLPIIIITGYADENVNSSKIPDFRLLKKPFHLDNLAATMIAALRFPERRAHNVVPLRTMTATSTSRQPL